MPLEDFGARLSALMETRGLSQTEIASTGKVSQPTIWRLLKVPGAKPSAELYVNLVTAYPELGAGYDEAASA